jgi:beta-mannosidase
MLKQTKIILLFLFNVFFSLNGFSVEKRLLHENWTFKTNTTVEWKKATVPGVVHLDLLNIGSITEPYFGDNEEKQNWIEKYDWEYRTFIEIDDNYLKNKHIELVFEGLDTYASVYLNGKEILVADNMFREWVIDVKPFLKGGQNELMLIFHSPVQYNAEKTFNAPYQLPAANESVDVMVSPYTRKAAYHFGWDWGPRFVTSGIYRPVYLRTWNDLRVENVSYKENNETQINKSVEFSFEVISDKVQKCDLTLDGITKEFALEKGLNIIKQNIEVNELKYWNPKGYGEQNFSTSSYSISVDNNIIVADKIKWALSKIELIQEKDAIGTSFYFNVNGQPFYAKGANYIPQDLFLPRVDSARYEKLIKQAVAANINMLRVWGGGIYENDYFYDLCDEYGILVWQDFMFANSMYPNDPAFLTNIQAEVEDNVKRLRNHPCIALWCGNNEIEVAWNNWGWQKQYDYSPADSAEIWNNYLHIFHEMIPNTLTKLDPNHDYVPTTPLSNWGKSENFNHSSMHYWGVWHGGDPIEKYAENIGRFMAEYGYQSYPVYETLAKVIAKEDLNLYSEVMGNRQKSYIGNGTIEENVIKYAYQESDFKKWIELSQLVQAHAYGLAIREHRMKTPHCMGTLFWQLNDCWPGPSWSVIDYYGNEKAAYDEVKTHYQPVIAKMEMDEDFVKLSLVSDYLQPFEVSVSISAENRDGRTAPILNESVTLNFLSPISFSERVPRKLVRTLTDKKGFSHFHIEVKSAGEHIFESNYYLKNQTTVEFPEE